MWVQRLLLLVILAAGTAKRNLKTNDRVSDESEEENYNQIKKKTDNRMPTTTLRSSEREAVVEKFVETLISSERYLKMIDTVERKVNHLETTFHDKSNSMLKYLTEILRMIKVLPAEVLQNSLQNVKTDLDKLKQAVSNRFEGKHPSMRVDGAEFHVDASLDSRLSFLENHAKSILTGVESIVSTISEVKNRQYSKPLQKIDGGSVDTAALINEFRRTLRDQKAKKCDCKLSRVDRSERYPTDCHEIQMQGFNVSGIYKIKPDDMEPFYVLCDLTTAGGGWTVFQNRFDGTQDFFKGWADYEHGFGNLAGEFWLGLEKLNALTNQKLYELRIDMETQHGQDAYAGYSVFTVGPEQEGYRISTLGNFYGTAGDSLSYHAGQKFSTFDMDNDEWKDGACAVEHGGAWWYKECDKSNLNGKYSMTSEDSQGQSVYWISFKGPNYPLSKTKMMIRPLPASKPVHYNDSNRKALESSKLRPVPDKLKGVARAKEVKSAYEMSHAHAPYRYDEPAHGGDAFFPNYA